MTRLALATLGTLLVLLGIGVVSRWRGFRQIDDARLGRRLHHRAVARGVCALELRGRNGVAAGLLTTYRRARVRRDLLLGAIVEYRTHLPAGA